MHRADPAGPVTASQHPPARPTTGDGPCATPNPSQHRPVRYRRHPVNRTPGRFTARLGIAIVAVTAAVISFTHVQHVAREAGESELSAILLPLSIDGAIAAPAAVILAETKAGRRPPRLAWVMLLLGLTASLAANIAAAEPTLVARAVAVWPPIALALGVEVLAGMGRRERGDTTGQTTTPAPSKPQPAERATPDHATGHDVVPDRPGHHLASEAGKPDADQAADQTGGPDTDQVADQTAGRTGQAEVQTGGPDTDQAADQTAGRTGQAEVQAAERATGRANAHTDQQATGPAQAAGPTAAPTHQAAAQAVGPQAASAGDGQTAPAGQAVARGGTQTVVQAIAAPVQAATVGRPRTMGTVSDRSPVQAGGERGSTPRVGASASRPATADDQAAIEQIRRLDAENGGGPVSRRVIQDALGCGASRADRLSKLARQAAGLAGVDGADEDARERRAA
ncbi:DUF2637 domain-containing protein [Promicromonospora sp. Marseille-Q5078]